MSKRKLTLSLGGSTPKKSGGTGTPSKLLQTEEHISLLVEKLKDHTMVVWEEIDMTQQEILSNVEERIKKLK